MVSNDTTPASHSAAIAWWFAGWTAACSAKSTNEARSPALRARSKPATESIGGLVFGMHITVVMPPIAAAALPLAKSSFCGWPGSRMWTCASTKPGNSSRPRASMTVSAAALSSRAQARRDPAIRRQDAAGRDAVAGHTPALWMHRVDDVIAARGPEQAIDRPRHDLRAGDDVGGARILAHMVAAAADRRHEQHAGGNAPREHHRIVSGAARQAHRADAEVPCGRLERVGNARRQWGGGNQRGRVDGDRQAAGA